jgi:hypothetical protein
MPIPPSFACLRAAFCRTSRDCLSEFRPVGKGKRGERHRSACWFYSATPTIWDRDEKRPKNSSLIVRSARTRPMAELRDPTNLEGGFGFTPRTQSMASLGCYIAILATAAMLQELLHFRDTGLRQTESATCRRAYHYRVFAPTFAGEHARESVNTHWNAN